MRYVFGRNNIANLKFFATLEEFIKWFQEKKPFLGAETGLYDISEGDAHLVYRPMCQHRVQYLQSEEGDRIFKSDAERRRWTRAGNAPSDEEISGMSEDELLEEIVKDRHPGTDYNKTLASLLVKKRNFNTFTEVGLNGKFIGIRKPFDDIRTVRIKWKVDEETDINRLIESRLPDEVEIRKLSGHRVELDQVCVSSNELF